MTQLQREALLDLLHIAILTDAHFSIKEDEALEKAIEALGWNSPKPREIHILNGLAKARRAIDSQAETAVFIMERAACFTTVDCQEKALLTMESLVVSDGVSTEEIAFMSQLRECFSEGLARGLEY